MVELGRNLEECTGGVEVDTSGVCQWSFKCGGVSRTLTLDWTALSGLKEL